MTVLIGQTLITLTSHSGSKFKFRPPGKNFRKFTPMHPRPPHPLRVHDQELCGREVIFPGLPALQVLLMVNLVYAYHVKEKGKSIHLHRKHFLYLLVAGLLGLKKKKRKEEACKLSFLCGIY